MHGKSAPKSRLAQDLQQALIDQARRMRPEERLKAFVEHSRLMVLLMQAGRRRRALLPHHSA